MNKLKKGNKVKCIDDNFQDKGTLTLEIEKMILPEKGKYYIVRDVLRGDSEGGLLLEEIRNNKHKGYEPAFYVDRFQYQSK